MKKMERLNKDEIYLIASNMEISDLINFSLMNKKIYLIVKYNFPIWNNLIKKDFLEHDLWNDNVFPTLREKYKLLFQLTKLENIIKFGIGIYNLYKTKRLVLTCNALSYVPKEIGILINLEHLSLSDNDLVSIPKEIGNLTNLKTLNLSHNKLRTIHSQISYLVNLEKLDLTNNKLYKLPKEIETLSNLKILDISLNEGLIYRENNKNLRVIRNN